MVFCEYFSHLKYILKLFWMIMADDGLWWYNDDLCIGCPSVYVKQCMLATVHVLIAKQKPMSNMDILWLKTLFGFKYITKVYQQLKILWNMLQYLTGAAG